MNEVRHICLLGVGEVGTRLAGNFEAVENLQLRAWDLKLGDPSSPPSATLQRFPGLIPAANAASAAEGCDLIISAVTAEQDLDAARSILPGLKPGAWFLDLNSVSPATKQAVAKLIESGGGQYVEAAIMAPIAPLGLSSPILLGGPRAEKFLPLAIRLGFGGATFFSAVTGTAAAAKMCRSVVIKGMEALLTEAMLTARHFGVEEQVIASLQNLLPRPDWPQHAGYMIARSIAHGTRRAEEMREVALTVREAGIEPLMSTACADRQAWAAQFTNALGHDGLPALLDAISSDLRERKTVDQHQGFTPGESQQQKMDNA